MGKKNAKNEDGTSKRSKVGWPGDVIKKVLESPMSIDPQSLDETDEEKIFSYIDKQLHKGKSDKQIKEKLISVGWSDKDISDTFKKLK